MTKNTCYFTLHRVRNIDVHDVENSISGPLDFKMGMPPDPPRGSRLRHSDLITPLINIPVNTNTPLKTSATRLKLYSKTSILANKDRITSRADIVVYIYDNILDNFKQIEKILEKSRSDFFLTLPECDLHFEGLK